MIDFIAHIFTIPSTPLYFPQEDRKGNATMETVTHIAGPTVKLGNRIIQRCMVCGEKLVDSKAHRKKHGKAYKSVNLAIYTGGMFVQCKGGTFLPTHCNIEEDPLPEDICLALVEE